MLLTSQALRGIAVGLWAATLGWILMRILNGAGRNAWRRSSSYPPTPSISRSTC